MEKGRGMRAERDIGDISRRSKFIFTNTMLCLLKSLEGKRVKVEIRSDWTIQGNLLSVDAAMGLNMTQVLMTDVKGRATRLELFYIHGRNIRYVHIPDEVDIIKTMNWELNKPLMFRESEKSKMRHIQQQKEKRQKKNIEKFQKK